MYILTTQVCDIDNDIYDVNIEINSPFINIKGRGVVYLNKFILNLY